MKKLITCAIVLALSGCGGKDKNSPVPDPINTGRFVDSAVEGLYYETETQTGYTQANGEFNYKNGETVSFYLGDILLGTTDVSSLLTPLDLIQEGDHSDKLQNILSLLQTFDEDANPDNGIVITSQTDDYISQFDININTPVEIFAANEAVQAILLAQTNSGQLVNAFEALSHFRRTLLNESRVETEEVVLDLMGTNWQASMKISGCESVDIYQLSFTIVGPISVGAHGVNSETCETERQAILGSTYELNSFWACSTQCTDSDLNRVVETNNGTALLQYINGQLVLTEETLSGNRTVLTLTQIL